MKRPDGLQQESKPVGTTGPKNLDPSQGERAKEASLTTG